MLASLADYLERFDVFDGVGFLDLYSWLPADIATIITSILTVFFVLSIIGLVRKFIPLN